ncbi:MAG TPA: wax ester/triacylglycerol synthase domain-containing protein [Acidimicrobiales bacterium]|nr:wax ester/triacylglycerol synthase domain-containing protein [Acidimicrobiales bacterium]
MAFTGAGAIDRLSGNDLMQLATDAAGVPAQVGGVLLLAPGPGGATALEADDVLAALERRVRSVPRLRQRLVRAPLGHGRPYWVDDPAFDLRRHVRVARCPAPGGAAELHRIATDLVTTPLPRDRPLWAAVAVDGLAPGGAALVVVFHHVLADGIGGLAVLGALVDPPGPPAGGPPDAVPFPRPAPAPADLLLDALRRRGLAFRHVGRATRRLRQGVAELRSAPHGAAPRSSLNRPTSRRRAVAVAHAPLAPLLAAAHAHRAKLNDVVLAGVGGALAELLAARGEALDTVVVSVPVSARREASTEDLGNAVGAFPVPVPLAGDVWSRLDAVASITRGRTAPSGASAAVLEPAFRTLAALHLLHRFVDRQHLVTTFVTNLRGPDTRLAFLGRTITDIAALSVTEGNVTVGFAVLSYAGTVAVTVMVDPDAITATEHALVVTALERHLAELAGSHATAA